MAKRSHSKSDADQAAPGAAAPEGEAAATAAPGPRGKNPAAVQLGRLGGQKGGPARARKLTKEQRIQIARQAAQARWAKRRQR
jgi:hypothetical protein